MECIKDSCRILALIYRKKKKAEGKQIPNLPSSFRVYYEQTKSARMKFIRWCGRGEPSPDAVTHPLKEKLLSKVPPKGIQR